MESSESPMNSGWAASVYYARSQVDSTLQHAWECMLDYKSWNPDFANATVIPVRGKPSTEGEVVLIKKPLLDVSGEPLPEFYAETAKLVPNSHIVWYVYPKEGYSFRNFVDFRVSQADSGVEFNIYYYEQNKLSGELLSKQRQEYQADLENLAMAFKKYCEKTRR